MTATVTQSRTDVLNSRLTALLAERGQGLAESVRESTGDVADRATNVEASIRLSILDERIASLQLDIADAQTDQHVDGLVSIGDSVVLDLGDGPETFVVGSVEQAAAGMDTVTPTSPLGQAIVGAEVGATVTYTPRRGLSLSAKILSAA